MPAGETWFIGTTLLVGCVTVMQEFESLRELELAVTQCFNATPGQVLPHGKPPSGRLQAGHCRKGALAPLQFKVYLINHL
ncbi:hypothetical protein QUB80_19740 [Chlorogloeopsis sp. ULAP01]|uniref:hypothetical protein n=1 Tax=Chlorogloeopsis sp. ULAP01 TaxID=3056483 RepID=UPI0025AAA035|nr:hypothetical protein [Chlorogloeopsis sp. ULAP01]MDM9382930.1 hypothetical protein [Chlorogloeopsis sp. ULAP01]